MTRRRLNTRINTRCCLAVGLQSARLLFMLAVSTLSCWAQTRLSPEFHLQYTDTAVLASRERRADFSCQVTLDKPGLGFDLRFHSGYRVTVPIKVLTDVGGWLRVVMRVTPAAHSEEPVYLIHRYSVPDIPLGAKGEGELAGGFDLGLGRYQVDWLMRDGRGRVCSSHWELEAKLGSGQQNLPLTLDPNMVAERVEGPFDEEPPVERAATQPLHLKILLNLSPFKPQESILGAGDAAVLLSMLRSITRESGFIRFTLVAFNLREQKIVDRQDNTEKIDFGQLGQAVQSSTSGTLNYHLLQDPRSETHFLTKLLTDQLGAAAASPDAIIILGPKVTLEKKLLLEPLKGGGATPFPIFYLNYNPNPLDEPRRDTIGSALKAYKGAVAYNIVLPRDLGAAMRNMLSRIGKRPTFGSRNQFSVSGSGWSCFPTIRGGEHPFLDVFFTTAGILSLRRAWRACCARPFSRDWRLGDATTLVIGPEASRFSATTVRVQRFPCVGSARCWFGRGGDAEDLTATSGGNSRHSCHLVFMHTRPPSEYSGTFARVLEINGP